MSDLKLQRNQDGEFDLVFNGSDLELTDDLETSVSISLFTWRRAPDDVPLPNQGFDLNGSWMDKTWEDPNDEMGSFLWLLGRSKNDAQLLIDAKKFSEQALNWMIEDNVASSVVATAERVDKETVFIQIEISRPQAAREEFQYFFNWEAQKARRA